MYKNRFFFFFVLHIQRFILKYEIKLLKFLIASVETIRKWYFHNTYKYLPFSMSCLAEYFEYSKSIYI